MSQQLTGTLFIYFVMLSDFGLLYIIHVLYLSLPSYVRVLELLLFFSVQSQLVPPEFPFPELQPGSSALSLGDHRTYLICRPSWAIFYNQIPRSSKSLFHIYTCLLCLFLNCFRFECKSKLCYPIRLVFNLNVKIISKFSFSNLKSPCFLLLCYI